MTEKRYKFKKEKKKLLLTLTKKQTNAVYGFCKRAEVNEFFKRVSTHWLRTEYADRVKEWFSLRNGNIMVELQHHE